MPIMYRPARAGDLEISDRLVVASINELTSGTASARWLHRVRRHFSCFR